MTTEDNQTQPHPVTNRQLLAIKPFSSGQPTVKLLTVPVCIDAPSQDGRITTSVSSQNSTNDDTNEISHQQTYYIS